MDLGVLLKLKGRVFEIPLFKNCMHFLKSKICFLNVAIENFRFIIGLMKSLCKIYCKALSKYAGYYTEVYF